ncbi:MAG: tetratricopeptide repeat protein [Adhaeribacter sp.]
MTIIHPIDSFLYELFPNAKNLSNSNDVLQEEMLKYYTIGPYKPLVAIKNNYIEVSIDIELIDQQQKEYRAVVALAEKGNFDAAKQKLLPLIEKAPHISEYHRVLGQIQSEQGDQEEAINSLIDALRWDPKNGWALLMTGNIFARYKMDAETALKYYDQAVKANPEDNITMNNIGAILMKAGRKKEAIDYFLKAMKIDPDYPNTYYALALVEEGERNLQGAFDYAIDAIKKNKNKDILYVQSLEYAIDIAKKIIQEGNGRRVVNKFTRALEERTGTRIDSTEDEKIDTAAKIEFAENYNRDRHIIRFKPSYPAVEHLVMHELVHLDFVIEARQVNKNQLFTSSLANSTAFDKAMAIDARRLRKQGLSEDSIRKFLSSLFNGLNLQVYNTPIDLFIEDYLYNTYKELRPYQFLSLMRMVQEGITGTTDKTIVSHAPKVVLSASKVYNLVNAMLLKDLFGADQIAGFKATQKEISQAEEFWGEFEEYRSNKEPAEEYELVQHWADDLGLSDFFKLVEEHTFRKGKKPEDIISDMEEDASDFGETDPYEEERMKVFLEQHQNKDLNMAVVMYMVDALKYFQNFSQEEVKKIAHEIAMKGMFGISPEKKDYKLPGIPGKTFSGYHLLAYYYVSWAIAEPEMLKELQLPFDKEYVVAKQLQTEK